MNIQFPVQQCQYCGSTNIGLGWQHGEALVTFKKHGLRGRCKIRAQKLRRKKKIRLWG